MEEEQRDRDLREKIKEELREEVEKELRKQFQKELEETDFGGKRETTEEKKEEKKERQLTSDSYIRKQLAKKKVAHSNNLLQKNSISEDGRILTTFPKFPQNFLKVFFHSILRFRLHSFPVCR